MIDCKRSAAYACGWFMALLLAGLLAGCGSGSNDSAATTVAPVTPPANVVPGAAGAPGAAVSNPTVGSSGQSNSATNIAINAPVTASFTQAMDPATINSATAPLTFTLKITGGASVPGSVVMSAGNTVATFTPTAASLAANTSYTATVSTAAKNAAGTAMANPVVWTFTTSPAGAPGSAATNPSVGSSNPGSGGTNVATSTNTGGTVSGKVLTATFTVAMNPATIVSPLPTSAASTFSLKQTVSGANEPGIVTMDASNTIATFTPTAAALAVNTQYTATVTIAATNAGGTAMATPITWDFTTGAALLTAHAPVPLGLAGNYVIFAGTGISQATSRIPAAITGDIGVGPGVTSTAITGFGLVLPAASAFSTSAQITGKAYAFDYAAPSPANVTTARADMITAYNDAAGRTAGTGAAFLNLGAGTLTTRTLVPGVYTWGSDVTIPAANTLTLSGGAEDVWIFQITGTLTTAATSNVILTGGALPKNVFWQVAGTSVTVGASPAHFEGVVLAKVAINFGSLATANSRLLAQAAVNLDATAVTQPAP